MSSRRSVTIGFRLTLILGTVSLAGCGKSPDQTPEALLQRAVFQVSPKVLHDYVGVYRLPSGALFPVMQEGDRLLAGTPPTELFAQTTRRFTSNNFFGEIRFDRDTHGDVQRLDYRLAKRSHWCERVDPLIAVDPTQLVDAGGFRLRMLKVGQGSPTIILEDGFGNGIEMQSSLQAALADVTCVVAYDHAGTGGSDLGPEPRDAQHTARELRAALSNAGVSPPFVLVGGSIGGDYCRVFAHEFPEDVAGLVLLDPTPDWDQLLRWAEVHAPSRAESYRRLAKQSGNEMNALMRRQEPGRSAEWAQLSATRGQARDALTLLHIPVIQITGAAGQQFSATVDDKVRFFDAWLREEIPHAEHVLAHRSAHAVSITDQKLVVEQVRRLLDRLRN